MEIRKIAMGDNAQVAQLIRGILERMKVPKKGTAYADKALDEMYEAYQKTTSIFYVVPLNKKIIACGGIAPLESDNGNLCELQKMYVSHSHRGRGLAQKVIDACFESAKTFGYAGCYLETLPEMKVAQQFYKKNGFQYLEAPLGNTGHTACTVRMLKNFI